MTKTEKYKQGLLIECAKHGEHDNWGYNKKFHQIVCNFCSEDRTKKYQNDDEYVFKKYLIWSKARCVKNGKEFNIDLDYIKKVYIKQKGLCALSKVELNESNLSLDRIDSSKGYIKGNIQWLDFSVNRMKSDFKQKEFIKICQLIALSAAGRQANKKRK